MKTKSEAKHPPALGIYCRVSTQKQAEKGISLFDQQQRGIEMAKKLNWSYQIFKDAGVSGDLPYKERPGFNSLIEKCLLKEITGIFVAHIDRLSRMSDDGLITLFIKNDIKLFSNNGEINIQDENQELLLRITKNVAEYEKKKTVRKIKNNWGCCRIMLMS